VIASCTNEKNIGNEVVNTKLLAHGESDLFQHFFVRSIFLQLMRRIPHFGEEIYLSIFFSEIISKRQKTFFGPPPAYSCFSSWDSWAKTSDSLIGL